MECPKEKCKHWNNSQEYCDHPEDWCARRPNKEYDDLYEPAITCSKFKRREMKFYPDQRVIHIPTGIMGTILVPVFPQYYIYIDYYWILFDGMDKPLQISDMEILAYHRGTKLRKSP